MGYQESWFYIEPQHKFKKLIQAYEKAEQSGYYEVAGAEPRSVIRAKLTAGPDTGRCATRSGRRSLTAR